MSLAEAALFVAAEDDALVSHSSVRLPVDAFYEAYNAAVQLNLQQAT